MAQSTQIFVVMGQIPFKGAEHHNICSYGFKMSLKVLRDTHLLTHAGKGGKLEFLVKLRY